MKKPWVGQPAAHGNNPRSRVFFVDLARARARTHARTYVRPTPPWLYGTLPNLLPTPTLETSPLPSHTRTFLVSFAIIFFFLLFLFFLCFFFLQRHGVVQLSLRSTPGISWKFLQVIPMSFSRKEINEYICVRVCFCVVFIFFRNKIVQEKVEVAIVVIFLIARKY